MIPLVLTQDGLGRVAVGMRQPSHVDYLKLVADTGATLTVPTGAKHVLSHARLILRTVHKYGSDFCCLCGK